jgi:hypothetical protein
MYCPVCGAEYRAGFSICSDCQVALVPDPPRSSAAGSAGKDEPLVTVWAGDDPLKHAEICEALERNDIPARTLHREERSFNLAVQPGFEVFVPAGFANSARAVVSDVAVADDDAAAQPPDPESGEFFPEDHEEDDENEAEELAGALNLDPLDADVKVWSGDDPDTAAMIASSLGENHIVYRCEPDLAQLKESRLDHDIDEITVFVFPEQARRAKAIIREILDASPPE